MTIFQMNFKSIESAGSGNKIKCIRGAKIWRRNHCLYQCHEAFPLEFLFGVLVSDVTFKFLMQFELIFVLV